jgi:hypothetical protein
LYPTVLSDKVPTGPPGAWMSAPDSIIEIVPGIKRNQPTLGGRDWLADSGHSAAVISSRRANSP